MDSHHLINTQELTINFNDIFNQNICLSKTRVVHYSELNWEILIHLEFELNLNWGSEQQILIWESRIFLTVQFLTKKDG